MDPFAPSTNCPKCDKQVYQAEQVLGPARKIYHKYCFKCTNCSKRLDSNFLEHDSEPFCRPCHRSNFGTRDLRSANLSPTRTTPLDLPPSMSPAIPEDTSTQLTSPVEEDSEPSAPPLAQSQSSPSPISPFRTATSLRQQTTGTAYTGTGFSPRTTLTPNYTGNMFTKPNGSGLNTGRIANKFGSSPQCPRCGKAVYFAEQVNAIGKKWHKACLTCNACRKRLDSYTLQEHDDEPYCKQCYTRQFGTRDLRSANLSPTSSTA